MWVWVGSLWEGVVGMGGFFGLVWGEGVVGVVGFGKGVGGVLVEEGYILVWFGVIVCCLEIVWEGVGVVVLGGRVV